MNTYSLHLVCTLQANLCFVDIDNHTIELPEDFPQLPNKPEFIKELSDVLLRFGLSPEGTSNPVALTSTPPPPRQTTSSSSSSSSSGTSGGLQSAAALKELVDDGRNGNLGREDMAVLELLQANPTLERLQALAKRTGVTVGRLEAIRRGVRDGEEADGETGGGGGAGKRSAEDEQELRGAKLSVQLREVFASRFATMFADYESFVIQSAPDLESWLTNREQMHNFDKVRRAHRRMHTLTHTHRHRKDQRKHRSK